MFISIISTVLVNCWLPNIIESICQFHVQISEYAINSTYSGIKHSIGFDDASNLKFIFGNGSSMTKKFWQKITKI